MSKKVDITFNPDLFNDVYWHLEEDFANTLLRYIILYGGSSASKTFTVVQKLITGMLSHPDDNTLILRKFAVDIRDSIFADFKAIISDWGLNEYFEIQQNYIQCTTGSFVRFRGLDDSEKIKGISQFKRVMLEEFNQFDEVDFKQIRKRLRGQANQQIIGVFNPIRDDHWLKINLFDKLDLKEVPMEPGTRISGKWISATGNARVYKLNYTDNRYIVGPNFLDQHTIDDFEADKINDYNYYQIYALGNWGKLRSGGEAYKKFNSARQVRNVKYNPDLPLHISFDFNVNPYITCLVYQGQGKSLWQINEFCMADPKNRTADACKEIERNYYAHESGMYIYGDASGMQEDTRSEKGYNDYRIILQALAKYRPVKKVGTRNPPVAMRINFINSIFDIGFEGIDFFIDPKCKETIKDFEYVLEESDGTKQKKKVKHPITGVSYEEYGHCTDASDYILCEYFKNEFAIYQRGRAKTPYVIGKAEHNPKKGY